MAKNYFVTAIGTDSGKTVASAILVEALKADYWKPIQAGMQETDTGTLKTLVSNNITKFHKEAYQLKSPMSPHAAAKIDKVEIELKNFSLPKSTNENLIIEGAGGLLVPINDKDVVADLIAQLDCEVVLVANLYLGSINHTLLTINELKRRAIPVKGIIFNGEENLESQSFILNYSGYKELLHIKKEETVSKETVLNYAQKINQNL